MEAHVWLTYVLSLKQRRCCTETTTHRIKVQFSTQPIKLHGSRRHCGYYIACSLQVVPYGPVCSLRQENISLCQIYKRQTRCCFFQCALKWCCSIVQRLKYTLSFAAYSAKLLSWQAAIGILASPHAHRHVWSCASHAQKAPPRGFIRGTQPSKHTAYAIQAPACAKDKALCATQRPICCSRPCLIATTQPSLAKNHAWRCSACENTHGVPTFCPRR